MVSLSISFEAQRLFSICLKAPVWQRQMGKKQWDDLHCVLGGGGWSFRYTVVGLNDPKYSYFRKFSLLFTSYPNSLLQAPLQLTQSQRSQTMGRTVASRSQGAWEHCGVVRGHFTGKQTPFDIEGHEGNCRNKMRTCILAQLFPWMLRNFSHLQSLHGLKLSEGSRDELGNSVVVQKPERVGEKQGFISVSVTAQQTGTPRRSSLYLYESTNVLMIYRNEWFSFRK